VRVEIHRSEKTEREAPGSVHFLTRSRGFSGEGQGGSTELALEGKIGRVHTSFRRGVIGKNGAQRGGGEKVLKKGMSLTKQGVVSKSGERKN